MPASSSRKNAAVVLPAGDDAVKKRTGRDWAQWRATLDDAGAQKLSHRELAQLIHDKFKGGDWWSQMVAVGYERMTGKRAVHEVCGGSFVANASKTLPVSAPTAFAAWMDETRRARWLPGVKLTIRKATAPKSVRITWPDETNVEVWITAKDESECVVAISHSKLSSAKDVATRKEFWKEALERLEAQL